eukprot:scaffold91375_cov60-Phaeocystis_antarctica.AAC.4
MDEVNTKRATARPVRSSWLTAWLRRSTDAPSAETKLRFCTSPSTKREWPLLTHGSRLRAKPPERSSTATTVKPNRVAHASATWLPMKPAAPVTSATGASAVDRRCEGRRPTKVCVSGCDAQAGLLLGMVASRVR